MWFNIDNKGKRTNNIHIQSLDKKGNKATFKGVEVFKSVSDSGSYTYNYKSDSLRQEVVAWLNTAGHKYSDVNTAFTKGTINQVNELVAIFNKDEYWTANT